MNKKKVAIITSGYFPIPPVKGGAIETLINVLYENNLSHHEIDLTIFSVYDQEAEKHKTDDHRNHIQYVKIPSAIRALDRISYFVFKTILRKKKHMSYRYIFQRLYYINGVSNIISECDYDRLIIENHPTLLGVLKRKHNNIKYKDKYYYHAHNEILRTFGYDDYLLQTKGFICVSHFIGKMVHEVLPDYPIDNIFVLRNRVDEKKFRNINEEKIQAFIDKYNIPQDKLLFTFTGRLNPEKGVKELLLAYKKVKPANAMLVIAGSYYFGSGITSEYEEELKQIAEEIRDSIIFTGNIDYDEMPCMYAVSDVIVLPSVWNDPAPLTVIESLTCGKPLITTYSGGIPEYANESNSILLHIDDDLIINLSDAIKTIANDEKKRSSLSESARRESDTWKTVEYYNDFISMI